MRPLFFRGSPGYFFFYKGRNEWGPRYPAAPLVHHHDRQVAFALRSCFLGTLRLLGGAEETPPMGAMPDTLLKKSRDSQDIFNYIKA